MMASDEMIRKMDLIVVPMNDGYFSFSFTQSPASRVGRWWCEMRCQKPPVHPSGMPAFRLIYGRQWSMSPIASINTKYQAIVADIASKIINRCSYFAKISTTLLAYSFIGQYPSLCQHKAELVYLVVEQSISLSRFQWRCQNTCKHAQLRHTWTC